MIIHHSLQGFSEISGSIAMSVKIHQEYYGKLPGYCELWASGRVWVQIHGFVYDIQHVLFCHDLSCLIVQSLVTLYDPWTAAHQASLSMTNSWSLLKLMSIESVMPSNHLILCCPLLLLPAIISSIRVFSNESVLRIRWPKNWNFSISPSSAYSGLIAFRMEWFVLLAIQGTLKSLLQCHSSKASILWHSAFFMVQPSHPYMTTRKTISFE